MRSGVPWEQLGLRVFTQTDDGIALAIGDTATARHVAVVVTGVAGAALEDAGEARRAPLGWARALRSTALVRTTDDVAVLLVAWDHLTAIAVRAAAPSLTRSVARLQMSRREPAHLTVLGHGLGAVAVALAAAQLGLHDDDDVVLLAAPGVPARSVGELGTSARVWAGRAATDWVRFVPPILGFGGRPTASSFGARPVDVRGVAGHDRYFDPGSSSLAALTAIVIGLSYPDGRTSPVS